MGDYRKLTRSSIGLWLVLPFASIVEAAPGEATGPAAASEPAAPTPSEPAPAAPPPSETEAEVIEAAEPAPSVPTDKERTEDAKRRILELMDEEFASDTETRDQPAKGGAFTDRLEQVLNQFVDIGGYFRAGYARSGAGGPMAPFQAPGAASKYRLGNEAENYGELVLGKNFYLPGAFQLDDGAPSDGTLEGPVARVQLRISFFNPYSAYGASNGTSVGLPEAWASIGNVLPFAPSVKFWAGNRFYRRHDIHVVDFFFWNTSGGGGGIEDVPIGPARLALAWIGWGSTSGLTYVPQPDPQNQAGFSKSTFDLRVYDIPLLFGHTEVGAAYVRSSNGVDQAGNQGNDTSGFAANLVHTIPKFLSEDGINKTSIQFGTGPARTFTAGYETVTLPTGSFILAEDDSAMRLRVTENFTTNLGEHVSVGPVVMFQWTNDGADDTDQLWLSAGVRPILHVTKNISLAFEGAVDWTKNEVTGTEGTLGKLTFAPQASIGNRFMSRPVIRAFVTGAFWSDDFVGQVGGLDYQASKDGLSAGMQMEAWW
jgi:maltoporin